MTHRRLVQLIVLVTLWVQCSSADSTSVAIIQTGAGISIVTDSEVSNASGEATGVDCKIRRVGNVYFVPTLYTDDWVIDLIMSSLKSPGTIGHKIERLETDLGPRLRTAVNLNPALVYLATNGGGDILNVNVLGYENKAFTVHLIQFHLLRGYGQYDVKIEEKTCESCKADSLFIVAAPPGNVPTINGWIREGMSPVEAGEKFVQGEIDKKVRGVGGPLQVLQLSAQGGKWIRRPDFCPK